MKGRKFYYRHTEKKQNYSKLFNAEDNAQLLYFRDAAFRKFVDENSDDTQEIRFAELYDRFRGVGVQLSLF